MQVNQHSLPLAPVHSMQLGHTLPRILQHIAYVDTRFGLPLLLKLDLSNGYYRVHLSPKAALKLAVVLPGIHPYKNLVGIPLCLPMRWTHSPPYFCAFTETAADIANHNLTHTMSPQPHHLDLSSQQHDVPRQSHYHSSVVHPPTALSQTRPLSYVDIYIDDFIGLAQQLITTTTLRTLLHAIDSVFCNYPHPLNHPNCKQHLSHEVGCRPWGLEHIQDNFRLAPRYRGRDHRSPTTQSSSPTRAIAPLPPWGTAPLVHSTQGCSLPFINLAERPGRSTQRLASAPPPNSTCLPP
jgi:hypothetical protein